jgi:hypothetical protein
MLGFTLMSFAMFCVVFEVTMPIVILFPVINLSFIMLIRNSMLSVVLLSVIILNIVMLRVIMLSVILLSIIILSVMMLSIIMLSVIMLSISMLSVILFVECNYAVLSFNMMRVKLITSLIVIILNVF